MKKIFNILVLYFLPLFVLAGNISVYDLRVENMDNPLGIDVTSPRFSWKISSDKNNILQTGYQIIAASSIDKLNKNEGDLWNSQMVNSDERLWISYLGKPLQSNEEVFWKARVFTNKGKSKWSSVQHFSIGLLTENQWKGRWVGLETMQPGEQRGLHTRLAARYLRREYSLTQRVKRATAYVAGLGVYEFYVNGRKVGGNHVLDPVPTDYRKTIYYNTYDITDLLNNSGKQAFGIILGNGRFFPPRQEKAYKELIFGLPKCRINIVLEMEDGKTITWATDEKWKLTTDGPILSNNEYDGEEYDASKELTGWNLVGYNDETWTNAERCDIPEGILKAQMTEGMIEEKYGKPVILKNNILDFGQNMAGWIGFHVRGSLGDTIRVKYAEKLNADGTLYTDNLRNALSEDIYVCNGKENGILWRPRFSYHGFRYAQVSGMKNIKQDDFMAYTVGDEMQETGELSTSDTILNKVLHNALWGIRSNYKGMPVDCPQRNERQPWLGDRTVGCLGESFLFNNERLYTKWMHDIVDGQRSDGAISNVTPTFWRYFEDNMTWPAVFPFACDMLYEQFGNKQPIVESYPSLKKWVNHMMDEYCDNGIITKDRYGDWCVPPEKLSLIHSQDPSRQTDGELISTAYGIRIMQLMEKFAKMQGLSDDADYWHSRESIMISAFNKNFLTVKPGTSLRPGHVLYPDSIFYGNNTATANLLPLAFGIVPDSIKKEVVKNVVANIMTKGDGHVTCGVIGISWLLRGLSDNGFADIAYLLATNATYPSWGYMAENGATTIWELWNGDKANPKMNSGNHVMLLGDFLTWCYQYLGGIRNPNEQNPLPSSNPECVAYKHFILKPSFEIEDCFQINASFDSPYGLIKSCWNKTLQRLHWEVQIPANTTASICFPDGEIKEVGSGSYTFDVNIPTKNPAVLKDEFLYDFAPFPQAHASTVLELKNGDLLASYFGGTKERNPDVCIWVSRKAKGSDHWSAPTLAGDGVFRLGSADALLGGVSGINDSTTSAALGPIKDHPEYQYHYDGNKHPLCRVADIQHLKRKACWNPVLFQMPNGDIWLFYKVGTTVDDWQGCAVISHDGGKTWGKREMLPKGFIGPVKNKPIILGNRLICGASTEAKGWKFHVELYDLRTKEWKYVGPVESTEAVKTDDKKMHPIDCIQPSILKLKDGRLKVLMRTHNGFLAQSYSSDNGETWTPVTLSDIPNNESGTDAVTLQDGRQILIYNNFQTIDGTKKGPRTPLSIAESDDGERWHHVLTLEDSPISQYSYPAIIQGRDGKLHCVYTWRRQRIAYKEIDLSRLK